MWACFYTALFVAVPTLSLWAAHHVKHQAAFFNWPYLLLSLFCMINAMISVWEISLFVNIQWIAENFQRLKKKHEKGTLPPVFMFQHVPVAEALSMKYWANVWLLYAFYDSSYADDKSYGFWVDTGNGLVTLLPSILFALGMTFDIMPARHLGLLGFVTFWQMLYGTCLYFWQFFHHKRLSEHGWRNRGFRNAMILVLVSNGIWMVFPALGMYNAYRLAIEGQPALDQLRSLSV